jgi:hypothetical protein
LTGQFGTTENLFPGDLTFGIVEHYRSCATIFGNDSGYTIPVAHRGLSNKRMACKITPYRAN